MESGRKFHTSGAISVYLTKEKQSNETTESIISYKKCKEMKKCSSSGECHRPGSMSVSMNVERPLSAKLKSSSIQAGGHVSGRPRLTPPSALPFSHFSLFSGSAKRRIDPSIRPQSIDTGRSIDPPLFLSLFSFWILLNKRTANDASRISLKNFRVFLYWISVS